MRRERGGMRRERGGVRRERGGLWRERGGLWRNRGGKSRKRRMSPAKNPIRTVRKNGKRSLKAKKSSTEVYIRMVLPAEQTTAIAKSMLERQAKPKDISVYGMDEFKPSHVQRADEPVKNNKRSKNRGRTSGGQKQKLENFTTIGPVLS
ncbi:hypothetical protein ACF0H5_023769 [Mactra antiquata]